MPAPGGHDPALLEGSSAPRPLGPGVGRAAAPPRPGAAPCGQAHWPLQPPALPPAYLMCSPKSGQEGSGNRFVSVGFPPRNSTKIASRRKEKRRLSLAGALRGRPSSGLGRGGGGSEPASRELGRGWDGTCWPGATRRRCPLGQSYACSSLRQWPVPSGCSTWAPGARQARPPGLQAGQGPQSRRPVVTVPRAINSGGSRSLGFPVRRYRWRLRHRE